LLLDASGVAAVAVAAARHNIFFFVLLNIIVFIIGLAVVFVVSTAFAFSYTHDEVKHEKHKNLFKPFFSILTFYFSVSFETPLIQHQLFLTLRSVDQRPKNYSKPSKRNTIFGEIAREQ
jgi:uncharacterized membrane protein YgaE (UPF0421/DUF939 family)